MTVRSVPKPARKPARKRGHNSTLPLPSKPMARGRMKKRPKSAATWAEQYHSPEFRDFVAAQACAVCGVRGYSVAAHTKGTEKPGMSQKASWRTLAPMCGPRPFIVVPQPGEMFPGCHDWYDNSAAFRRVHARKIRAAIRNLHAAWRAFTAGAE